jgi:hypothetical protein
VYGGAAQPAQPAVQPATPADPNAPFAFNGPNSGTNSRIIRVPVTQLKNGDLRYNIVVRPQDMIIAPLPTTASTTSTGTSTAPACTA